MLLFFLSTVSVEMSALLLDSVMSEIVRFLVSGTSSCRIVAAVTHSVTLPSRVPCRDTSWLTHELTNWLF